MSCGTLGYAMQAARGPSLSTEDDDRTGPEKTDPSTAQSAGSRRIVGYVWIFWVVALVAYAADQAAKWQAVRRLADRTDDVPVIGDLLTLHLVYNPGAAFGMGTRFTVLLTCLAIVATCVVLVIARRIRDKVWAAGLGLLLAGITGNLTDRLLRDPSPFRGHVVDYLRLPNWPVFNIADICINVAAAVIVIQTLRGIRLDGTKIDSEGEDE